MESELLNVAEFAVSQPGIVGYMCVDHDGLCLAAKGVINQSMSGVIYQLAELANKKDPWQQRNPESSTPDKKIPPVIKVDLDRYKMLIQSRESITTALISLQK